MGNGLRLQGKWAVQWHRKGVYVKEGHMELRFLMWGFFDSCSLDGEDCLRFKIALYLGKIVN